MQRGSGKQLQHPCGDVAVQRAALGIGRLAGTDLFRDHRAVQHHDPGSGNFGAKQFGRSAALVVQALANGEAQGCGRQQRTDAGGQIGVCGRGQADRRQQLLQGMAHLAMPEDQRPAFLYFLQRIVPRTG